MYRGNRSLLEVTVGDQLHQVDQQEQVHRVAPPPRSHIHQEL